MSEFEKIFLDAFDAAEQAEREDKDAEGTDEKEP